MFTFSPNTKAESAKVNQNFTDLSTGDGDTDANKLVLTRADSSFSYVASGLVWSVSSGLTLAMTAGVAYVTNASGIMLRASIVAIISRVFTASKDTYVDVDSVGVVYYTEVANNAASPTLSAGRIRIAIIVTAAAAIATGGINQGEETKILPIVSSVPYAVTDSLGNLICPRDPNRKILGYRQILSNFNTTSLTAVQVTGLTCPVIVPTGRKVKVSVYTYLLYSSGASTRAEFSIWDGVVSSGTQIALAAGLTVSGSATVSGAASAVVTPQSASKTYNGGLLTIAAGTAVISTAATIAAYIMVELV